MSEKCQQQTSPRALGMSERWQMLNHAPQQPAFLFDHLQIATTSDRVIPTPVAAAIAMAPPGATTGTTAMRPSNIACPATTGSTADSKNGGSARMSACDMRDRWT